MSNEQKTHPQGRSGRGAGISPVEIDSGIVAHERRLAGKIGIGEVLPRQSANELSVSQRKATEAAPCWSRYVTTISCSPSDSSVAAVKAVDAPGSCHWSISISVDNQP